MIFSFFHSSREETTFGSSDIGNILVPISHFLLMHVHGSYKNLQKSYLYYLLLLVPMSQNKFCIFFFFLFSDKPPEEELKQFLEFQLPRQWAPVFSDLPLGPQRKQQSTSSLQFTFMGPKLYVNTSMVKVYFLSTAFLLFLKPLFLEHAHTNLDNMEVRKRYMELSALSCSENGLKPRTMCFPKLQ